MVNENAAAVQNETSKYSRCTEVLEKERELVTKIAGMQTIIRKAVLNRQWMDFETQMSALGQIGAQFEVVDQERIRIFAAISGKAGEDAAGFYALASHFPPDEWRALTGVYRSLKTETRKVRLESSALANYLNEASVVVAGFLDAVFPDRKGKIYSRNGAQVHADMRSMVVNHHF
jgi:hypothetical protein